AALSKFESGSTIAGALPPSSREILFTCSEALLINVLPIFVEPVKDIFLIRSSLNNLSEISVELPVKMLATPLSIPVAINSSKIAIAILGVSLDGLTITVHPAANAGATLRATIAPGKFQGVIKPHTPTGCLITEIRWFSDDGGIISP